MSIDIYHKSDNIPTKHNVLSVSAFVAERSYKSIEDYVRGLDKLQELIDMLNNNFYLYVFHDKTIEETKHYNPKINELVRNKWIPLLSKLKNNPKVVLIRYNYPKFKSPSNQFYHISTFGTIIRFLPLFEGNSGIVIISDIDEITDEKLILVTERYKHFMESNADFYFRTKLCYNLTPWSRIATLQKLTKLRIVASNIISKIKLPISIFENFLEGLHNGTAIEKDDLEYMQKYAKITKFKQKNKGISSNIFQYGFDEYFANHDILPYLIKHKKKILALLLAEKPRNIFRKLFINIQIETNTFDDMTNKQREVFTKLLKDILGDKYDSNKSLYDNYNSGINYIDDPKFVSNMYDSLLKLKSNGDNKILHITNLEYDCIEDAINNNEDRYIAVGGRNKRIRLVRYNI